MATATDDGTTKSGTYYFAPPPPVVPTNTPRPGVPALPGIPKPVLYPGQNSSPSSGGGGGCSGCGGPTIGGNNPPTIPGNGPAPLPGATPLGAPSLLRADTTEEPMNRNWLMLALAFAAGYYIGKR